MPIEKTANHINTDRRRLKKMSPSLWKEFLSLPDLTTLYFETISGLDEYLPRLNELSNVKEIGFLNVEMGQNLEFLSLSNTCHKLLFKTVWGNFFDKMPIINNIKEIELSSLDSNVLAQILSKTPSLETIEIKNPRDAEEVISVKRSLESLKSLRNLHISAYDIAIEYIETFFMIAKNNNVRLSWETGDLTEIVIKDAARRFEVDCDIQLM